jgi:hypothetical protein
VKYAASRVTTTSLTKVPEEAKSYVASVSPVRAS